jgi:5'-3' exonuclease
MRAKPARRGATVTIVSSDKDLMQLVTDGVNDVRHDEGQAHRPPR